MSTLQAWLDGQPHARFAPLFETEGLQVITHQRGKGERRSLTRSAAFDQAVIDLVESGCRTTPGPA